MSVHEHLRSSRARRPPRWHGADLALVDSSSPVLYYALRRSRSCLAGVSARGRPPRARYIRVGPLTSLPREQCVMTLGHRRCRSAGEGAAGVGVRSSESTRRWSGRSSSSCRLLRQDVDDAGRPLAAARRADRAWEPARLPGWLATHHPASACGAAHRGDARRRCPPPEDQLPAVPMPRWSSKDHHRRARRGAARGFAELPPSCHRLLSSADHDTPRSYATSAPHWDAGG